MNQINLQLTLDEVNFLLNVLGELPTRTNSFPLMMNIKNQAEAQVNKENQNADKEV